ncbi:MAG: hypothetical protein ACYS5V_11125 [Planctomycetota bacterium]|jgi:hypothetical protein
MEPLVDIVLAQKERWPVANYIWLAALVILTVLSYVARKAAERAEEEQKKREMGYKADTEAPLAAGGPPPLAGAGREPRRPRAPARRTRPVPTAAPARRAPAEAAPHGTVRVAPGTITEVRPGTLAEQERLAPVSVSEAVEQPLPPAETPGRLAPAAAAGALEAQVRNRVDLRGREELVRAVIYSEILGPPKALRAGPESWER